MDGHIGETLAAYRKVTSGEALAAVSKLGALRSHEWVHRVISLLEAAVDQLHNQVHPAQGKLLEAASLLRQQIDPPAARAVPDLGRGRLLAWQARARLCVTMIDSHIYRAGTRRGSLRIARSAQ